MSKRMVLAALAAGVGMFVWSSIAHDALPLGRVGIREIPNETALLGGMTSTLGAASGLYLFPAMDQQAGSGMSETMERYAKKLAVNPSGLLVYHAPGARPITPGQLITEFLTELLETFLAVVLLARSRVQGFAARAGFVTLIGIVAAIATNIPYWNWYGFPASYTAAYAGIQVAGFLVAGLIAAALLKAPAAGTRTA